MYSSKVAGDVNLLYPSTKLEVKERVEAANQK